MDKSRESYAFPPLDTTNMPLELSRWRRSQVLVDTVSAKQRSFAPCAEVKVS